jgi:hypothetical protein
MDEEFVLWCTMPRQVNRVLCRSAKGTTNATTRVHFTQGLRHRRMFCCHHAGRPWSWASDPSLIITLRFTAYVLPPLSSILNAISDGHLSYESGVRLNFAAHLASLVDGRTPVLRCGVFRQPGRFLQLLNQTGNSPYVQTGIRTPRTTIRSEHSARIDAQTILVQR